MEEMEDDPLSVLLHTSSERKVSQNPASQILRGQKTPNLDKVLDGKVHTTSKGNTKDTNTDFKNSDSSGSLKSKPPYKESLHSVRTEQSENRFGLGLGQNTVKQKEETEKSTTKLEDILSLDDISLDEGLFLGHSNSDKEEEEEEIDIKVEARSRIHSDGSEEDINDLFVSQHGVLAYNKSKKGKQVKPPVPPRPRIPPRPVKLSNVVPERPGISSTKQNESYPDETEKISDLLEAYAQVDHTDLEKLIPGEVSEIRHSSENINESDESCKEKTEKDGHSLKIDESNFNFEEYINQQQKKCSTGLLD